MCKAMKNNEQDTENIILEAAEAEFLEKGYGGAKMLSIARRAGVAHSMLHYYYRNKENLFQTIFVKKVQMMLPTYEDLFNEELGFAEVLRRLRDARDRFFWTQNPRLPYFLLTEILGSRKNQELFLQIMEKAVPRQLARLKELFEAEVAQGTLYPLSFMDFMKVLITIDASSLSALYICAEVHKLDEEILNRLRKTYREHNMQLILDALRP